MVRIINEMTGMKKTLNGLTNESKGKMAAMANGMTVAVEKISEVQDGLKDAMVGIVDAVKEATKVKNKVEGVMVTVTNALDEVTNIKDRLNEAIPSNMAASATNPTAHD